MCLGGKTRYSEGEEILKNNQKAGVVTQVMKWSWA